MFFQRSLILSKHSQVLLQFLLLGLVFLPDWTFAVSRVWFLSFLCCSLALSSTSIPTVYYGSGHDRLSCTGRVTASASRSPGGLRWQELVVTDISPHLISEWAKNNLVSCCFTTTSTLCALFQTIWCIKEDILYSSSKGKFNFLRAQLVFLIEEVTESE